MHLGPRVQAEPAPWVSLAEVLLGSRQSLLGSLRRLGRYRTFLLGHLYALGHPLEVARARLRCGHHRPGRDGRDTLRQSRPVYGQCRVSWTRVSASLESYDRIWPSRNLPRLRYTRPCYAGLVAGRAVG